ncbi:hypothetical protein [Antarctobacter jejuensis]|uniref:hypothetical protein n=1 Tax=Antarctobacter jejuensis TaxID=1439938 RepID=UPI003FD362BA
MRSALAYCAICLSTGAVWAQPEPLPEFSTCMDIAVDRYEQDLRRLRERPEDARDFDIGDVRGVDFCGTVGIVRCDRSEEPLACQRALTVEQDALKDTILALLPDPATVTGEGFAHALYPQVWLLAQGSSSGPDCAGQEAAMHTWCEAREANSRLRSTVLAWQVARYLDAAEPAIAAGWASPPPPVRPRARPEGLKP